MKLSVSYSDTKKQLEILKDQGLIFENLDFADLMLQTYGYSSIIKSYRDPYVYVDESGKKRYRENVSFEQVYSLYLMDKNLRAAIFTSMLEIEEYIKNNASEIISKDFGTDPLNYLNQRNYRDKARNKNFSLSNILGKMNKTLVETQKDPIYHYKTKYGIVPPWILFKGVYFSTIVNLVRDFKPAQMEQMAVKMYEINKGFLLEDAKALLVDTMFICNEYRNLCAHGGRAYNYTTDSSCRFFPSDTGLVLLLQILRKLKNQVPYNIVNAALSNEVNRHCTLFPQDVTYLGQILHINIQHKEYVWISETSKKMHGNPYCSGLKNAIKREYISELDKHYTKCKKCLNK